MITVEKIEYQLYQKYYGLNAHVHTKWYHDYALQLAK